MGAGTSKWPPNPVSYPRLPRKPVLVGNGGSFCTRQRVPIPASTRPCAWWGRPGRPVPWMLRKRPLSESQGAFQKFSSPCPLLVPLPPPVSRPFLHPEPAQKTTVSTGRGISSDLQRYSAISFSGVVGSLCHRGSSWEMWTQGSPEKSIVQFMNGKKEKKYDTKPPITLSVKQYLNMLNDTEFAFMWRQRTESGQRQKRVHAFKTGELYL